MLNKICVFILIFLGLGALQALAADSIQSQTYTHEKLNMTVVEANFSLPAGNWKLINSDSLTDLRELQFGPTEVHDIQYGDRYHQIANEKVKSYIQRFYYQIRNYAEQNSDFRITSDEYADNPEELYELINTLCREHETQPPQLQSIEQAIDWINASSIPLELHKKYSDQHNYGQMYNALQKIQKEYKKKISEFSSEELEQLVNTHLGQQFKRSYLIGRYGLKSIKHFPPKLQGPAQISDLDEHLRTAFNMKLNDSGGLFSQTPNDAKYFLIPNATLIDANNKNLSGDPLVIELYPHIDDGKHWILLTNGKAERRAIEQTFLQKYNINVQAQDASSKGQTISYFFRALQTNGSTGIIDLEFENSNTGNATTKRIDSKNALAGDKNVFEAWTKHRLQQWANLYLITPSIVYQTWLNQASTLYDLPEYNQLGIAAPRRNQANRNTSFFNMLGGRAAIEETLQMQNLVVRNDSQLDSSQSVIIKQIPGVEVKAHNYDEMLGQEVGGELQMAHWAPADRFFLYFKTPKDLSKYLDGGVEFIHQSGTDFLGKNLNYNLKEKYFARLGLDAKWVKKFLKSGLVKETAVLLPDLFLIDGTDISIVLNIPNLNLMQPLLKLIGISQLNSNELTEIGEEHKTYWYTKDQWLVISTHKSEIQGIMDLMHSNGMGSLGKSAEFRYMLTQLPLQENTNAFAYFSDPFIRRMVGPEVKIPQYRRLRERAILEMITAAALLYKKDGHTEAPSIEILAKLGYIPLNINLESYQLDEDLIAYSADYGHAANLSTILDLNILEASPGEAKAYKLYVDNYSRYWRQFFDPIAIRYDELPNNNYELNVYILPLIDSSIYETARSSLSHQHQDTELIIPRIVPEPVMTFSANLNEATWLNVVKGFTFLKKYMNLDPRIFDEFGPSLHLAVMDADPIINFGSNDIMGVFGAGGTQFLQARESMWIPLAMMMFTRPTKLIFELKDSDQVIRYLSEVSSFAGDFDSGARRGTRVHFDQIEDTNEWNCRIEAMGLLNLNFGIQVQNGFLVFSNIPWSRHEISSSENSEQLSALALQLRPGAAEQQLAGLYNSAVKSMAVNTRRSMAYLAPLVYEANMDITQAQELHSILFGFAPEHSGNGQFEWKDRTIISSEYGSLWERQQPRYRDGDRNFGLFRKFNSLDVSMQFENEGLRTRLHWTLN